MFLSNKLKASQATFVSSVSPGLTYIGSNLDTGSASSYTFTSEPIGVADSSRMVVVCVSGYNTGNSGWTNCTVGGVTYSLNVSISNQRNPVNIFGVYLSTGTTANIVLTGNGTMQNCSISVYAMYGDGSYTFEDTNNIGTGATGSADQSVVLTCSSGANIVALATAENSVSGSFTAGITNNDFSANQENLWTITGHSNNVTSGNKTITASFSNSSSRKRVVAVSII